MLLHLDTGIPFVMSRCAQAASEVTSHQLHNDPAVFGHILDHGVNLTVWERPVESAVLVDADSLQAAAGEIVLLKGALWQDNEAFGAIHRSPDITGNQPLRTVVTLDPLWTE